MKMSKSSSLRCCRSSSLLSAYGGGLWLLLLWFLVSCSMSNHNHHHQVSAQRAILDFGKRLEKRPGSSSSSHSTTNQQQHRSGDVTDTLDQGEKQQQQQQQRKFGDKGDGSKSHPFYYIHHIYTMAAGILVIIFCFEQVRETRNRGKAMRRASAAAAAAAVPTASGSGSNALTLSQQQQQQQQRGGGSAVAPIRRSRVVDSFLEQQSNLQSIGDDGDDSSRHNRQTPVDLSFEHIRLLLRKKKKTETLLLDGSIHGRAQPGRMLAIMGPSGAGKSTLLHALAGQLVDNPNMSLSGRRYMNGQLITGDSLLPAALIEQQVNFFAHMTVQETLEFRVQLKLGRVLTRRAQDAMVQDLLQQVGLIKARHTIVGDTKVRGISGGERKRLSIAVEMISSPAIIFLDEPTSGLDSNAATSLMENLRDLAVNSGKTIVAVIHQPSQHVFSQFDDLLLLSEGRQMYFGPVDQVRSYMTQLGYQPAPEVGTAEHVIDCVARATIMPGEADLQAASARVDHIAKQALIQKVPLNIKINDDSKENNKVVAKRYTGQSTRRRANVLVQFKLLLGRAIAETFRGKVSLIIKLVQQVSLGLIYGGIYRLGSNQASIQDRYGLLSLIAIGSMNMAVAATIRSFPKEKEIVAGEISSKLYSTLPYFIAKALSEIPLVGFMNCLFGFIVYRLTGLNRAKGRFQTFLALISLHSLTAEGAGLVISSISPNSDVALAIFPAVVVLNIIFDGKNISEENTPKLLRWIPKVGLIRWGFEGLCINEFTGLKFDSSGPPRGPIAKTGTEALARFGLDQKTVGQVLKAQLAIIGTSWVLSYLGLSFTKLRFLVMKEPNNGDSVNGNNNNNKNGGGDGGHAKSE